MASCPRYFLPAISLPSMISMQLQQIAYQCHRIAAPAAGLGADQNFVSHSVIASLSTEWVQYTVFLSRGLSTGLFGALPLVETGFYR